MMLKILAILVLLADPHSGDGAVLAVVLIMADFIWRWHLNNVLERDMADAYQRGFDEGRQRERRGY